MRHKLNNYQHLHFSAGAVLFWGSRHLLQIYMLPQKMKNVQVI